MSGQMYSDPLSALYAYYQDWKDIHERLSNPALTFGWGYQNYDCEIVIDEDGTLQDVVKVCREEPLPLSPVRTSNVAPGCLCDNYDYMLGLTVNKKKGKNGEEIKTVGLSTKEGRYEDVVVSYMDAFVAVWKKLARIAPECKEIQAVLRFYERYNPSDILNNKVFTGVIQDTKQAVFSLADGRRLHSVPAVVKAVSIYIEQQYADSTRCICRLSGEEDAVCKTWHELIGGGDSGLRATYYQPKSSHRYGYMQGDNALVGVHSEWAIYTIFKELCRNMVVLGDTKYIFWSDDGCDPSEIRRFFTAVEKKGVYNPVDADPVCYVLGFCNVGQKGLCFKTFICDKLSAFDKHIRYFQDIAIEYGFDADNIRLWRIIEALNEYRDFPRKINGKRTWEPFNSTWICHKCGDELVDVLFTGKGFTSSWWKNILSRHEKLVRKGYLDNSESMRWLIVLIAYGLTKANEQEQKGKEE